MPRILTPEDKKRVGEILKDKAEFLMVYCSTVNIGYSLKELNAKLEEMNKF